METFIAVCLALIVVELGVLVAALTFAALRIQKTAQAVEVLSYRVEEEVASFGEGMRSGWMRGLQAVVSLFWGGRRR